MNTYVQAPFLPGFGARVELHWSVLLVAAGIMAASFRTPINGAALVAAYFGILYVHELGHAFVARRLGYRPYEIRLSFVHGRVCFEAPRTERDAALIAWGGASAQLAVALPLVLLAQLTNAGSLPVLGPAIAFLGYLSLLIAAVNLAPARGLDGYIAWRLFRNLKLPTRHRPKAPKSVAGSKVIKGPWAGP
ncbi:hypothetical protein [Cognatilysobacter terrigena]|uniref:hypothetical protein n=1 Tax=Cognatilysobacter terrigena TaxID=2488749 RepID=UPI0010611889|nr:hypothetical protein [Lysobacter terrigena]